MAHITFLYPLMWSSFRKQVGLNEASGLQLVAELPECPSCCYEATWSDGFRL